MMLSADKALEYVNKLYDHGFRTFVLTGGEPLLNNDISSIVRSIKQKDNTYISLLTNGTLIHLHQELIREIDNIIVSMDVQGSTNRIGLNYAEVLGNLSRLEDKLKQKITIRSVISQGEEQYLEAMKEKVERMGMKYIFVPRLPNCVDDLKYLPDMCLLSHAHPQHSEEYRPSKCGAGSSVLAIDWNGDIYPCQNLMENEFRLGSLNDQQWFQAIRDFPIIDELHHANVLEIEECKDCYVHFLCGGGCRALSYKVYGSLSHRLDFFCDYFREDAKRKLSEITYSKKK